MGRKKQRKSIAIRLGITPKSRWKNCEHYYIDAYRFGDFKPSGGEEDGIGFRVLWFIVSFALLVD